MKILPGMGGIFVMGYKDLGLALREARAMGLELPGLALASERDDRVQALGYGRKGTQALMRTQEEM